MVHPPPPPPTQQPPWPDLMQIGMHCVARNEVIGHGVQLRIYLHSVA